MVDDKPLPARRREIPRRAPAIALMLVLAACGSKNSATDQQALAGGNSLPALPAALPMTGSMTGSGAGPAPVAYAPPLARLPVSRPVRMGRLSRPDDGYAYLDRAWYFDDALDGAPPDYTYDYDGVNPWGWDLAGGGRVRIEPVRDGWRRYYYGPGADTPFLVSDPAYSYAYDGPELVAMYDAGGGPIELVPGTPMLRYASGYYDRAVMLARADRAERRVGVSGPVWAQYRPRVQSDWRTWAGNLQRSGQWRAWHESHQRDAQQFWAPHREARREEAQRFAGWEQTRFAGPPPAFGRPGGYDRPGPGPQAALRPAEAVALAGAGAVIAHKLTQPRAAPVQPAPMLSPRPGWSQPGRPIGPDRNGPDRYGEAARIAHDRQIADTHQRQAQAIERQQTATRQRQAVMVERRQVMARTGQVQLAERRAAVAQQRHAVIVERRQVMAQAGQAQLAERRAAIAQQRQAMMVERRQAMAQQRQAQMVARGQAVARQRQMMMAERREPPVRPPRAAPPPRYQAVAPPRHEVMTPPRRVAVAPPHPAIAHPGDHGGRHGEGHVRPH